MPTTRVKLATNGKPGLNNDGVYRGDTRYLPPLEFIDKYLADLAKRS